MSISVTDEFQGRGIGSILVGQLAQAAADHGITTFIAEVLPENHAMIGVFRASGFEVSIRAKPGAIEVEFPTAVTERRSSSTSSASRGSRERDARVPVASLGRRDRRLARRGTIGGEIFRNL